MQRVVGAKAVRNGERIGDTDGIRCLRGEYRHPGSSLIRLQFNLKPGRAGEESRVIEYGRQGGGTFQTVEMARASSREILFIQFNTQVSLFE